MWKCVDPELEWQIRCFPYGKHSDVPGLQQVKQKSRRTAEESRTTLYWENSSSTVNASTPNHYNIYFFLIIHVYSGTLKYIRGRYQSIYSHLWLHSIQSTLELFNSVKLTDFNRKVNRFEIVKWMTVNIVNIKFA
jgi:hypothetical protein